MAIQPLPGEQVGTKGTAGIKSGSELEDYTEQKPALTVTELTADEKLLSSDLSDVETFTVDVRQERGRRGRTIYAWDIWSDVRGKVGGGNSLSPRSLEEAKSFIFNERMNDPEHRGFLGLTSNDIVFINGTQFQGSSFGELERSQRQQETYERLTAEQKAAQERAKQQEEAKRNFRGTFSDEAMNIALKTSVGDPMPGSELEAQQAARWEVAGQTFSKRDIAEQYAKQLNEKARAEYQAQPMQEVVGDPVTFKPASISKAQVQPSPKTPITFMAGFDIGKSGEVPSNITKAPIDVSSLWMTPVKQKVDIATEKYVAGVYEWPGIAKEPEALKESRAFQELKGVGASVLAGVGRVPQFASDIGTGVELIAREPKESAKLVPAGLGIMAGGFAANPVRSAGEIIGLTIGTAGLGLVKGGFKPAVKVSEARALPDIKAGRSVKDEWVASVKMRPPEDFPFDLYGGEHAVTVKRGVSGMEIVGSTAVAVGVLGGGKPARAAQGDLSTKIIDDVTPARTRAYEIATQEAGTIPDFIKIDEPHSPAKVTTNLKQLDSIEFNKKVAKKLTDEGMLDIELDRKGNVVKKYKGEFDPQATDEILIESDYFNKVKAEAKVKHNKLINLGTEQPGIISFEKMPARGLQEGTYSFIIQKKPTRAPLGQELKDLGQGVKDIGRDVKKGVKEYVDPLGRKVKTTGTFIKRGFIPEDLKGTVVEDFGQGLKELKGDVKYGLRSIGQDVTEAIQPKVKYVKRSVRGAGTFIKKGFIPADLKGTIIEDFGHGFKELGRDVKKGVKEYTDPLSRKVKTTGKFIKKGFIPEDLKGTVVEDFGQGFRELGRDVKTGISSIGQDVKSTLKKPIQKYKSRQFYKKYDVLVKYTPRDSTARQEGTRSTKKIIKPSKKDSIRDLSLSVLENKQMPPLPKIEPIPPKPRGEYKEIRTRSGQILLQEVKQKQEAKVEVLDLRELDRQITEKTKVKTIARQRAKIIPAFISSGRDLQASKQFSGVVMRDLTGVSAKPVSSQRVHELEIPIQKGTLDELVGTIPQQKQKTSQRQREVFTQRARGKAIVYVPKFLKEKTGKPPRPKEPLFFRTQRRQPIIEPFEDIDLFGEGKKRRRR